MTRFVKKMEKFDFDIDIRPPRSRLRNFALFCGTVFFVWSGMQIFLNFDAFAQIAKFKIEKVAEIFVPEKKPLEKINAKKTVFRNQKIAPQNHAKNLFAKMVVLPSDDRLVIPRIGKNVPLVAVPNHKNWNQLEKNIQSGLRKGVVVHPISRTPGNAGNFFLTGHSSFYRWDPGRFKDVFALLHEVKIGDTVQIFWKNKNFEYIVREKKVVAPTEVEVLAQPDDREILTLMTCTPVGTNKNRLIVVAEPKN